MSALRFELPDQLESKLTQALAVKNRLIFVDVMVDGTEHIYPMQIRNSDIDEIWLIKRRRPYHAPYFIGITGKRIWRVIPGDQIISQRGYNIESLTVAPTDDLTLSRMAIQTMGDKNVLEQIEKQLHKLVDVLHASELGQGSGSHVKLEIILVKVQASGFQREKVKHCAKIFRGQIVDVTPAIYTAQLAGSIKKIGRISRHRARGSKNY